MCLFLYSFLVRLFDGHDSLKIVMIQYYQLSYTKGSILSLFQQSLQPMNIVKASVFLREILTLEACYVHGRSISRGILAARRRFEVGWNNGDPGSKVPSELSVMGLLKNDVAWRS